MKKFQAVITKLNGYYTNNEYVGEGGTVEVAIKRARKVAYENGEALISGEIDVYRLYNDEVMNSYGEWVQKSKYVGTFGV